MNRALRTSLAVASILLPLDVVHAAEPGSVATLRVPDQGIQPQVAVDGNGRVHMLYFRGDPANGDVFYVRSTDHGETFSNAIQVNSQPGSVIAVGNIRGAQLALGNGRVHVAWNGSGKAEPQGPAGANPLLYTRSNEEGTAFEPQRNVIQEAYGLDGGGSVAADEAGNVYVAWHAPGPGAKGEESRQVWLARSTDEGATFAHETVASNEPTGACGCCGLRVFADRRGHLFLLYRSAVESVHRDMYLLTSLDRGEQFRGLDLHRWQIESCPMSSAAFAEGPASVLAAWETQGQVYFCRIDPKSGKRSKPLSPPGDAGGRKHPALAGNERGETLLAWTEGVQWNRGGAVAWQVFDKQGKPTGKRGRTDGVPTWSLVAAFTRPDGSFAVVY